MVSCFELSSTTPQKKLSEEMRVSHVFSMFSLYFPCSLTHVFPLVRLTSHWCPDFQAPQRRAEGAPAPRKSDFSQPILANHIYSPWHLLWFPWFLTKFFMEWNVIVLYSSDVGQFLTISLWLFCSQRGTSKDLCTPTMYTRALLWGSE